MAIQGIEGVLSQMQATASMARSQSVDTQPTISFAGQLHAALSLLFADPAEARRRAEAGLGVLRANQGALARLLAGLQELLKRA